MKYPSYVVLSAVTFLFWGLCCICISNQKMSRSMRWILIVRLPPNFKGHSQKSLHLFSGSDDYDRLGSLLVIFFYSLIHFWYISSCQFIKIPWQVLNNSDQPMAQMICVFYLRDAALSFICTVTSKLCMNKLLVNAMLVCRINSPRSRTLIWAGRPNLHPRRLSPSSWL